MTVNWNAVLSKCFHRRLFSHSLSKYIKARKSPERSLCPVWHHGIVRVVSLLVLIGCVLMYSVYVTAAWCKVLMFYAHSYAEVNNFFVCDGWATLFKWMSRNTWVWVPGFNTLHDAQTVTIAVKNRPLYIGWQRSKMLGYLKKKAFKIELSKNVLFFNQFSLIDHLKLQIFNNIITHNHTHCPVSLPLSHDVWNTAYISLPV